MVSFLRIFLNNLKINKSSKGTFLYYVIQKLAFLTPLSRNAKPYKCFLQCKVLSLIFCGSATEDRFNVFFSTKILESSLHWTPLLKNPENRSCYNLPIGIFHIRNFEQMVFQIVEFNNVFTSCQFTNIYRYKHSIHSYTSTRHVYFWAENFQMLQNFLGLT